MRLAETQVTECVSTITQNNQTKMSILKGRPKTYRKRALPEELITQLSAEGLGAKAIATQLKKQGVVVSYRTILRFLNGQGNG